MTDSQISFSIEIANTIGLEEAILLEYIKKNESLDKISLKQIYFYDIALKYSFKRYVLKRYIFGYIYN